jgi:hypothetical protein
VYLVAGRDGTEKISTFVQSGLHSHNNLFFGNKVDWQSPLSWSRNLDLRLAEVQRFKDLGLEQSSSSARPNLDRTGHSHAECPSLGKGAAVPLPSYIGQSEAWHIGLGSMRRPVSRGENEWTLSIIGSAASVGPEEQVELQAVLVNEFGGHAIDLGGDRDLILTFHFRYRGGHRDKQELYPCRVELPDRRIEPGERLDLTTLPGWKTPVNGDLGDPFHLRVDTDQWQQGCRLRATARFVDRSEPTSKALQQLVDLIRSREVLPVELRIQ